MRQLFLILHRGSQAGSTGPVACQGSLDTPAGSAGNGRDPFGAAGLFSL